MPESRVLKPISAMAFFALCFMMPTFVFAATWPEFRGPGSRGVRDDSSVPTNWSATENIAWKTPLPGRGWSSPVISNGMVFLTSVVSGGEVEAPKKGLYFGGERPEPSESDHQWFVYGLDLATGEIRWKREVHAGKPLAPVHVKNSYASETPVTDGERVYVYFGALGVFCFDVDGTPRWEKRMEPRKMRYGWGTAASPTLYKDRLYIVNDNEETSYLLSLDATNGDEVWRVERDEASNWATPFQPVKR